MSEKRKLDPAKVGIAGFLTGGHLASTIATKFDNAAPVQDAIQQFSCRQDFMLLFYPVVSFKDEFIHKGSRSDLLGFS